MSWQAVVFIFLLKIDVSFNQKDFGMAMLAGLSSRYLGAHIHSDFEHHKPFLHTAWN
jgi:hypothetical protein